MRKTSVKPHFQMLVDKHYCVISVLRFVCSFRSYFTSDTYANEHSACAARIAAGLCADLASSIVCGRTKNGFALVCCPFVKHIFYKC